MTEMNNAYTAQPQPEPQPQPQPAPAAYGPGYYYMPPQPPRLRAEATGKDRAFGWLTLVYGVLWCAMALFRGFYTGYAIIMPLFFVPMTVYLLGRGARLRLYPLLCGLLGAGLCLPFALHNDPGLRFAGFCVTVALYAVYGAVLTQSHSFAPGGFRFALDGVLTVVAYPFLYMPAMLRSVFGKQPVADPAAPPPARGRAGKVLLGLLCGLVALAILLPLMIRSDAVMEDLFAHITLDLSELVGQLILGVVLAALLFSLLFAWKKGFARPKPKPAAPAWAPMPPAAPTGVDPVVVQTFLGVLAAAFALYVTTQAIGLAGVLQHNLPGTQTMADYARRGFFEMCGIAALTLAMLFGAMVTVRKQNGDVPPLTRGLGLFTVVAMLAVIGSALFKMYMYIDRFGLTPLRLVTSGFMALLVVTFLAVGIRLLARRFPYMKVVTLALAVLVLAFSWCDVSTTVARYNLQAYRQGQLETIDVQALDGLSDGAVPVLVELLDDADPAVARAAHDQLVRRFFHTFRVTGKNGEENDYTAPELYYWEDIPEWERAPADLPTDYDRLIKQITVEPRWDTNDFRAYNVDLANAQQLLLQNAPRILAPDPRTGVFRW